jgi:cholesterol oxidase
MDFDLIVIGSGFGGAITACRLAEKGYKRVLILERGRRWDRTTYPRGPEDPWIWNHEHPESENGWLDLRVFERMSVAQGAGVGGGSLIYANISCEPRSDIFQEGWPKEITYQELKPHYDAVARFMNVQPVPTNQWPVRTNLMKEAADAIGEGGRFKQLELAVTFDPKWTYHEPDPHNFNKSVRFTNPQGVEQGTCVHLGNCDIGCDVDAKNTLDKNYIPWAEKHGAEVRPCHLVTNIEPVSGGYKVSFDELKNGGRIPGSQTARIVIVAAGSLGSTELLLRCRDLNRSLPQISRFLGHDWSSNGDFLTPALYKHREIFPTKGPTITSSIDFLDRSENGESFWIEDGGFPNLFVGYLQARARKIHFGTRAMALLTALHGILLSGDPLQHIMPWFAQGVDAANGVLELKRPWWYFGMPELRLQWDVAKSQPTIDAIVKMHGRLARATGGIPMVPPTWSLDRYLITPHPLGGCNMGDTFANGVVDHKGEVFGYHNLFVADAAIIPEALGVNPSRTIGALAERIAKMIAVEGR